MPSAAELVPDSYLDAYRARRAIGTEARRAVLAAMGLAPDDDATLDDSVAVAPAGTALARPGELTLEDGTAVGRVAALPPDLPHGYHRLRHDDGVEQLLITGPGRCHLPAGIREWGWAVQLATTRSRRSWGIGDLGDLRDLAAWSRSAGAGFVAVSPLGAPNPGPAPDPSPYYPSTRRFGNPIHVAVEALPGADLLRELATRGRALGDDPRVDRAAILRVKLAGLERLWRQSPIDVAALEMWRRERGPSLERWAIFCTLSERLGSDWRTWPEEYRDPTRAGVVALAGDERVAFHVWVQWCFDRQLAAVASELRHVADLPVGVDPGGFDAWDWQDQLAVGATVGVPPDRFNAVGQDWGMPPFVPQRLRRAGYAPFIDTVRSQLRHAGGMRLDHVLGLFRQWWVPAGTHPSQGAYVRQPTHELMEIVALESVRASALIVAEDLGTVPTGVRPELRRRRMLSTRLALFERRRPAAYPRQSVAAVTTHDLPTIAGIWTGADLADQAASGVTPDAREMERLRRRLLRAAGVGADAALATVVPALHRELAASPSMLVAATLEDALGVPQRPNLPGTVASQRDNWSQALPIPIDDFPSHAGIGSLVEALRR